MELYLLDEARYLIGHILPAPPREVYICLVIVLESDILWIERYRGKYLVSTFDNLNVHVERTGDFVSGDSYCSAPQHTLKNLFTYWLVHPIQTWKLCLTLARPKLTFVNPVR